MVPYRVPQHCETLWSLLVQTYPVDRIMSECDFFFESPIKRMRLAAERLQQYRWDKWVDTDPRELSYQVESFCASSPTQRKELWALLLMQCVSDRDIKSAKKLIAQCARERDSPQAKFDRLVADRSISILCAPLQMACARGDQRMFDLLLASGFQMDSIDLLGFQPIFVAIYFGRHSLLESMVESKQMRNVWLDTPLHFSIRQMQDEACVVLLRHGADVNCLDLTGHTPLSLACHTWSMERMVLPLLELGARFDPRAQSFDIKLSYGITRTSLRALAIMGARGDQKYNPIIADMQRQVNIERRMPLVLLVGERP